MTNFDFLLSSPDFASFGEAAAAAEKIYSIDPAACIINCRRAMEFAVKWMYSVDSALTLPWDDKLASLLSTEEFRDIVDENLQRRLDYIRRVGNSAAHDGRKITREQAMLCPQNLWVFLDFVAYCYGDSYTPGAFDPALVQQQAAPVLPDKIQMTAADARTGDKQVAAADGSQHPFAAYRQAGVFRQLSGSSEHHQLPDSTGVRQLSQAAAVCTAVRQHQTESPQHNQNPKKSKNVPHCE